MKDFLNGPNFMPFCWTLTFIGLAFMLGINWGQIIQLLNAVKGVFCLG